MIFLGSAIVQAGETQHACASSLRARMYRALAGGEEPPLCAAPGGKPYYAKSAVRFSVSHSGKIAVCAFSVPGLAEADGYTVLEAGSGAPEVGVDVELVRAPGDAARLRRIAARFFPAEKQRQLAPLSDAAYPRAFCEAWTMYESYVKMTGAGFGHGFSQLELTGICFPCGTLYAGGDEYIVRAAFPARIP